MIFKNICTEMIRASNQERGRAMREAINYRFEFLGVTPAERRQLCAPFYVTEAKVELPIDWEYVHTCWIQNYREFQYAALDYLVYFKRRLSEDAFTQIFEMITYRPWWDTNQILFKLLGYMNRRFPDQVEEIWQHVTARNEWEVAATLSYQIGYRSDYNLAFFLEAVKAGMALDTPVTRFATAYALIDYASYNPNWVEAFAKDHAEDFPADFFTTIQKEVDRARAEANNVKEPSLNQNEEVRENGLEKGQAGANDESTTDDEVDARSSDKAGTNDQVGTTEAAPSTLPIYDPEDNDYYTTQEQLYNITL